MNVLFSGRSMLWVLIFLGAPLTVAGQPDSEAEAHRSEARRVLRRAAAPFSPAGSEPPAISGLLPQIAEAQARAGDLAGARQTAGGLRSSQEKAEALASVAGELARTGRVPEALELAAQIAALSPKPAEQPSPGPAAVPGVREDAILQHYYGEALGSVVLAQAVTGDLKGAHATLARMEPMEYRCAALFAIAAARLNAGDAAGARELLQTSEDFRKCFTEAEGADRALIDPATALAFIQEANGQRPLTTDFRRVLRLWVWMYSLDDVEEFGYLIGMKAKAGHQDQVDQVLAVGARHETAAPDRVEAFVVGLLWARDLKTARRAAETFPGEETQSRVRRLVAEALAREGDFAGALQIAGPIKMGSLRAVALATVAAMQMQKDPGPAARRVLQEAITAAASVREVPPRFRALCRIAQAQAAAGDRAAARKSLEQAADVARTPFESLDWRLFVGDLVQAHLDIGDTAGAQHLVSVPSGPKLLPQERTPLLLEIAGALARTGTRDEADRLFAQALDLAASEDLQWDACDIAQAWAHSGGAPRAAAAAERIASPGQRSLTLLGVAKGLLQLANPDFYIAEPRSWLFAAGPSFRRGSYIGLRASALPSSASIFNSKP